MQVANTVITGWLIGLSLICTSCNNNTATTAGTEILSKDSVVQIAKAAYIYGYPLVVMELTRKVATNVAEDSGTGFAPINQIGHKRQFPDATFTQVVKPNCDTYYSSAFFDVKAEPIVLSVPATNRYYLLPLLDAWTNVIASPGTRTTGTKAGHFLIAGPHWQGTVPTHMQLLRSPTNMVWMIGRTKVNSDEDGRKVVHPIQNGYKAVPLSQFGKAYILPKGTVNPAYVNMIPGEDAGKMSITDFFNELARLMVDNPPSAADSVMLKKMAAIGVVPGQPFSLTKFDATTQEALNKVPAAIQQGLVAMSDKGDPKQLVNGWKYMTAKVGEFGTDYQLRAAVAYGGLGANSPQDAVYPGTTVDDKGAPLQANHQYVLHFDKNGLPPVNAFWSLTLYNDREFLAANPINRFAIGDRNALRYNADSSLDIYLQQTSPGKLKESNWLPTPQSGIFKLTMRLYWPKETVLNRTWQPPVVTRVD